jgi:hypothetical protein
MPREYRPSKAKRESNPTSSRRSLGRRRHSRFRICIALCRTCAPILSARRTTSHLQKGCGHPFREPLQFIVMSVMGGTFPDTYRVFYMTANCGVFGDRHAIVMGIVTEETPCLSGFLAGVTVMTLIKMVCGRFLAGVPLIGQGLVAVRPNLRPAAIRHPSQTTADSSSDKLLRPSARSGAV